jgi:NAD(P)-dependent dehydrogenase (short-subunit alcohol dehydrogenase family)
LTTHDFSDIKAIVTGGSSGIGAAACADLASRGARVVSLDLAPGTPMPGVHHVRCDVASTVHVASAVDEAIALLGGVDVLISNAGVGVRGSVEDATDEDWQRVLNINVVGAARICRAVLPWLRESSHAAIVLTTSAVAGVGLPDRAVYAASKGALEALTRSMAADYLHVPIRVNAVAPGVVETPWQDRAILSAEDPDRLRAELLALQPMQRMSTPQEVANAMTFLAHPSNATLTGVILPVDAGLRAIPPRLTQPAAGLSSAPP